MGVEFYKASLSANTRVSGRTGRDKFYLAAAHSSITYLSCTWVGFVLCFRFRGSTILWIKFYCIMEEEGITDDGRKRERKEIATKKE